MGAYTRKPRAMLKYPHVGPGPKGGSSRRAATTMAAAEAATPAPMRCLSLWQPWATAIALGLKKIETRSWQTSYRGPIAIHAAQHWNYESRLFLRAILIKLEENADLFNPYLINGEYKLPLGKIVAVANLIDCEPAHWVGKLSDEEKLLGDYAEGRWAWILTDITPLPEPIPSIGRQGLYRSPSIESLLPPLPPVKS